ncbi:acyl-CoA thioesterase [Faecalibacter rhinopitheci]|uniref:Acyl-CoA thioesterase n=1 Tax=Faecalibacter rhinopitheci TaxID=2779678 RepID=A0A8J7FSN8_9FLAO|nr:thioesterase family protein [Faecalibacter rhinopitheci]MBF0598200.1 acyl-CoA thioesterase [Faecalibacter rhinopitheci]MBQ0147846.1 acyl-CoA thioesterase [Candidatus Onthonaster equi]
MNLENFKFYHPLEIRWNDLDPIGHVNNVYYIEYFQIGRGFYMIDSSKKWDWTKNMFVIAHIECDYYKELKLLSKNPRIGLRVSRLGNKSFDFEYVIVSDDKDGIPIVHAKGLSTQVLVDLTLGKSIELPEWLKTDIQTYEIALEK